MHLNSNYLVNITESASNIPSESHCDRKQQMDQNY